jgi:hypothetical protein
MDIAADMGISLDLTILQLLQVVLLRGSLAYHQVQGLLRYTKIRHTTYVIRRLEIRIFDYAGRQQYRRETAACIRKLLRSLVFDHSNKVHASLVQSPVGIIIIH